jgi:hypothetical protein
MSCKNAVGKINHEICASGAAPIQKQEWEMSLSEFIGIRIQKDIESTQKDLDHNQRRIQEISTFDGMDEVTRQNNLRYFQNNAKHNIDTLRRLGKWQSRSMRPMAGRMAGEN